MSSPDWCPGEASGRDMSGADEVQSLARSRSELVGETGVVAMMIENRPQWSVSAPPFHLHFQLLRT